MSSVVILRALYRAAGSQQFKRVMKRANCGDPAGPAAPKIDTFQRIRRDPGRFPDDDQRLSDSAHIYDIMSLKRAPLLTGTLCRLPTAVEVLT